MTLPFQTSLAQQNDRQERRAEIQEAARERWMQRQQEMQEQQWQRRNRLDIPQQFDSVPRGFPSEAGSDNWRDRRGAGRMSPEERQALRRQIQEAGRSVYPQPNK